MPTTVEKTIAAIVERSDKIELKFGSSTPLALVRDPSGRYRLTEKLFAFEDALAGRYYIWRADGTSVPNGHTVTPDEATAAVRTLLGLDEPRAIAVVAPPPARHRSL